MKTKKITTIALSALLCASMVLPLAACKNDQGDERIDYYSGEDTDALGESLIDENLFFKNEHKGPNADPFVLDNTARDGYYYIYSTIGHFIVYRSKNMMDLEPVTPLLDFAADSVEYRVANSMCWAPEVVYDDADECYYMFFSASPQSYWYCSDGTEVSPGMGIGVGDGGDQGCNMYVARSDSPTGPFELVNFRDEAAQEGGYYHDYNTETGKVMEGEENVGRMGTDGSGNNTIYTGFNTVYEFAYPQEFIEYCYFHPELYRESAQDGTQGGMDEYVSQGINRGIDPHPYEYNGKKYLFWTSSRGPNFILGVQMREREDGTSSWLDPDWDTFKVITACYYWTPEDYLAEKNGETVEHVPYEDTDPYSDGAQQINEGPELLHRNGRFYLTYSIGWYEDNSYQVCVAVSDSDDPLGNYTKLPEDMGGILLSGKTTGSQEATGTGHHSFVTVGDQEYIYYHTHDTSAMGGPRHGNIDELEWVTIEDEDGNDFDIPYVNGPSGVIQPRIHGDAANGLSPYYNVAEDATVSVPEEALAEGSSASWANDGLLSTVRMSGGIQMYDTFIQETRLTQTAVVTVDLAEAADVTAIMVYVSKYANEAFTRLPLVQFEDVNGHVYYLENVELCSDYYTASDYNGEIMYIAVAAPIYAEFYELADIKTVRITVEVPEYASSIGISEIRILGK